MKEKKQFSRLWIGLCSQCGKEKELYDSEFILDQEPMCEECYPGPDRPLKNLSNTSQTCRPERSDES